MPDHGHRTSIGMYETEGAFQVVAEHVVACMLDDGERLWEQWELHPEVGEKDWHRIVEIIKGRFRFPDADTFNKAYSMLEDRANVEEGPQ